MTFLKNTYIYILVSFLISKPKPNNNKMRNKIDCPFPQVPNRPLNSHKHDKPSCITCINLDESA